MELITTEELIERLKISESTLTAIRKEDATFPAPHKLGKRAIRWNWPVIEAWVAAR